MRRQGMSVLAVFVLAWALACVLATERSGVAGFSATSDGMVTAVQANSPADQAGLRKGDRLLGGRAPGSPAILPLGRVPAGEWRTLAVLRDEVEREFEVQFAERSGADRWRPRLFIGLGLWLLASTGINYWRFPGRLTGILYLAGAGIGLACLGEPDFDSPVWRAALMAVRNVIVLAGLGAMVQFALEYVHAGRRAHWVYVPLAAYWLVLDWRLLAPGATALTGVVGVLGGVLLVLALALVLVAISRGWIRGRRNDQPPGIGPVFVATLGGLALLLAAATLQRVAETRGLVDAAGVLFLLSVSWAWARAARRS